MEFCGGPMEQAEHEKEPIQRGAGHPHIEGCRGRTDGAGRVRAAQPGPGDVLRVEAEAWRDGGGRDAAAADGNGRLKRLVADQAVQIQILKEVNAKKW